MNINDKIFAALYDVVNQSVESKLVEFRKMTAGVASGQVLEIGAGTGANFTFYRPDTKLTVLENNELPGLHDGETRDSITERESKTKNGDL